MKTSRFIASPAKHYATSDLVEKAQITGGMKGSSGGSCVAVVIVVAIFLLVVVVAACLSGLSALVCSENQ